MVEPSTTRRDDGQPRPRRSLPVRVLEHVHLWTQALLPALGSVGLLRIQGEDQIGRLLMFGWLPILVFQLLGFGHHRTPRSTAAALVMALAVPAELAVMHALFADTPLYFFTDLFLVELVGLLLAMPTVLVYMTRGEPRDREWIAAFVVLLAIGLPLIVWVLIPFWVGRSDDAVWLAGMAFGVLLAIATRFDAMRSGPAAGEAFATPWMVRGFVLWVAAVLVTFYTS